MIYWRSCRTGRLVRLTSQLADKSETTAALLVASPALLTMCPKSMFWKYFSGRQVFHTNEQSIFQYVWEVLFVTGWVLLEAEMQLWVEEGSSGMLLRSTHGKGRGRSRITQREGELLCSLRGRLGWCCKDSKDEIALQSWPELGARQPGLSIFMPIGFWIWSTPRREHHFEHGSSLWLSKSPKGAKVGGMHQDTASSWGNESFIPEKVPHSIHKTVTSVSTRLSGIKQDSLLLSAKSLSWANNVLWTSRGGIYCTEFPKCI